MITISGLLPFTMIDYPGKLAAVIFCQGCPLACPYCHNPHMQNLNDPTDASWDDTLALLEKRKNLLDGVVFSGGEPLMQPNLKQALETVKGMGFAVALHTSGVMPDRLAEVLPLLDWVGLDIKSPFAQYAAATGTKADAKMGKAAERALNMILASGIPFEVRTTTDPRVITPNQVLELATYLAGKGVKSYALQEYRPAENGRLPEPETSAIRAFYDDKELLKKLESLFPDFNVRRG